MFTVEFESPQRHSSESPIPQNIISLLRANELCDVWFGTQKRANGSVKEMCQNKHKSFPGSLLTTWADSERLIIFASERAFKVKSWGRTADNKIHRDEALI